MSVRTLEVHVWLEVDEEDDASNAEIALEVRRMLERHNFAVVDVEDWPDE